MIRLSTTLDQKERFNQFPLDRRILSLVSNLTRLAKYMETGADADSLALIAAQARQYCEWIAREHSGEQLAIFVATDSFLEAFLSEIRNSRKPHQSWAKHSRGLAKGLELLVEN